jgi:hypothetical protein
VGFFGKSQRDDESSAWALRVSQIRNTVMLVKAKAAVMQLVTDSDPRTHFRIDRIYYHVPVFATEIATSYLEFLGCGV